MSYKVHISQFNEDIYFTETWFNWSASVVGNVVLGEQPVPFNAYAKVLPHRGTTDYNSGWVQFMATGVNWFYRIMFTAAEDTGYFDIAYYSEGQYTGMRMKFDFTAGVDENAKYLAFQLNRNAYTNQASFDAPGPWTIYVRQWAGLGGVGVWNGTKYDYNSNGVIYSMTEYYNGAGPWTPTFPQTADSIKNPDLYHGFIMLQSASCWMHYQIPSTQYTRGYFSVYHGENWDPSQIVNTEGEPAGPGDYDPNQGDPGGPSGPGGGDGDHGGRYDPIAVPTIPTIGPNSAGFIYMLTLTVGQMQQFAAEIVKPTMWQAFKDLFADPLDFMCGVMLVPYSPVQGVAVRPMYGDNTFDHVYNIVHQQYTEIDCGSIFVNKYYGSCFDHNPYHKLLLWLPYIGYRELDPDEFSGKYIHVVYHCDCMTGDCVAFVESVSGGMGPAFSRVVAQFSGNCGVRVPYGRTSYDAAVAASIQLLGGAIGMAAGGALGVGGLAAGNITAGQIANSIQGSTIMAVNGGKMGSERSGTAGASAGYLSIQKPYLLRTVQRQSLPENYISLEGYPSNMAGPLNQFSGFAAVETIKLSGISATDAEKSEIMSLLTGGIFI